jgi:hypothetical protein
MVLAVVEYTPDKDPQQQPMKRGGRYDDQLSAHQRRRMRAVHEALGRPWWRRDVVIAALEIAYPAWLSAPQVRDICAGLDARARGDRVDLVARTLGRLHSYGIADRIGAPNVYGERAFTNQGKPSAKPADTKPGAGYRFRIRREAEDLL